MIMANGQSIVVKCDVKSTGRDVFDMIVAHSNLVEHFYFGLAYIDGNTLSLVMDGWMEIKKKKRDFADFTIYLHVFLFLSPLSQIMSSSSWTMTPGYPRSPPTVGRKCLHPHLFFSSE